MSLKNLSANKTLKSIANKLQNQRVHRLYKLFEKKFDIKDDFAVAKRDGFIVFISTSRNKEMMAKGLVKDIARRLQTLRKERGYNPTDVLEVASILELDEESLEMIKEKNEELAFLVRVKKVNFEKSCKEYKDDDIDGQKIKISVE